MSESVAQLSMLMKPGRDREAGGVDLVAARAPAEVADRGDAVAAIADIGDRPAAARCRRRPCRPGG